MKEYDETIRKVLLKIARKQKVGPPFPRKWLKERLDVIYAELPDKYKDKVSTREGFTRALLADKLVEKRAKTT